MLPTRLGLEIIELLPEHAEAVWFDCSLREDDPDKAAIEGWNEGTWAPLRARYYAARSIVDLAIAVRAWRHGLFSTVWDEETVDPAQVVADRLCAAVLQAAGIDEAKLDIGQIWRARGWEDRDPTADERRAAVASLEDVDDAA
jgi:hypothetical protein